MPLTNHKRVERHLSRVICAALCSSAKLSLSIPMQSPISPAGMLRDPQRDDVDGNSIDWVTSCAINGERFLRGQAYWDLKYTMGGTSIGVHQGGVMDRPATMAKVVSRFPKVSLWLKTMPELKRPPKVFPSTGSGGHRLCHAHTDRDLVSQGDDMRGLLVVEWPRVRRGISRPRPPDHTCPGGQCQRRWRGRMARQGKTMW